MRQLKLFNGRDWKCQGGRLYVAAYSAKDAIDLVNEAYRKLRGYTDRPDIRVVSVSELRTYWSKGCWGNSMDGVTPERGVWWGKEDGRGMALKPERIL